MKCALCGTEIHEGDKYCAFCGAKIEKNSSAESRTYDANTTNITTNNDRTKKEDLNINTTNGKKNVNPGKIILIVFLVGILVNAFIFAGVHYIIDEFKYDFGDIEDDFYEEFYNEFDDEYYYDDDYGDYFNDYFGEDINDYFGEDINDYFGEYFDEFNDDYYGGSNDYDDKIQEI